MRIGILFGGPSREREISFAGGRTVYDNLNKEIFTPVPVFIDSFANFILLDWQYIYKGTIRDFYPPVEFLPESPNHFQVYIESLGNLSAEEQDKIIRKVGKKIQPSELKEYMDFAFLTLHGTFGEDGSIQGLLESFKIPYSGSGILPSAIGINKAVQKELMENAGFTVPGYFTIDRKRWLNPATDKAALFGELKKKTGLPCVFKPANQGSSIGVSVLKEDDLNAFIRAVDSALFIYHLSSEKWTAFSQAEKIDFIKAWGDIRSGLGLPVEANGEVIYHPEKLLEYLNAHFSDSKATLTFEALDGENTVLAESFIEGKEFSCIVVRTESGKGIALPPTEIVKGKEVFDYRSKYLPGLSRKETPINLPDDQIRAIRVECERLFEVFRFNVYARIDGFIKEDGTIYLNDPNTTSGMLPSSFFFHQAAEIGLNPSQFLTYIIRTSVQERIQSSCYNYSYRALLRQMDEKINSLHKKAFEKTRIAVFLGGYSSERHISVESGRNIYEKLASSGSYEPLPVFITGGDTAHTLTQIPLNLLLKDNADDIRSKIENFKEKEILKEIKAACSEITSKYAYSDQVFEPKTISYADLAELVDGVFIALHGRPGEDGAVQQELEKYGLPYNGSGVDSSQVTINKFTTNQRLREAGLQTSVQFVPSKEAWLADKNKMIEEIEKATPYPFIAKPVDDGCSSAVKKIKDREQLSAYAELIFRETEELPEAAIHKLDLAPKEEIPRKKEFLIEELVSKKDAKYFLEITGGLLTHYNGDVIYEVFEPSEAVANKEILSLEEKFLAGEGQNITPARFSPNPAENKKVSEEVRKYLERVAEILDIQGYARIDAFVRIYEDGKVETVIIEVNSLPGMTPATCIFHQAAINNYKPYDFIDEILKFGFRKQKKVMA